MLDKLKIFACLDDSLHADKRGESLHVVIYSKVRIHSR